MQRLLIVASLLLGTATVPTAAQVSRITAPGTEATLARSIDPLTRASVLGELAQRTMGDDDIEVRAWTIRWQPQGIALRREHGEWRAWLMHGDICGTVVPISVYDTVSAATRERYFAEARPNCGKPPRNTESRVGSFAYLGFDTLLVTELPKSPAIENAWRTAVDSGLLALPLDAPRQLRLDGMSYVIEVRHGREYRVSMIPHLQTPDLEAHWRVQAVFAALASAVTADALLTH
jgi:hypothetical protein